MRKTAAHSDRRKCRFKREAPESWGSSMGMAEEAASLRSKTEAPRPTPGEPKKPDSRIWSAVKKKYREREDRLNAEGLLTWDAIDSAVKEFAPLARRRRGIETHGTLKRYWRIVLEKRFDPGKFDDKHFR